MSETYSGPRADDHRSRWHWHWRPCPRCLPSAAGVHQNWVGSWLFSARAKHIQELLCRECANADDSTGLMPCQAVVLCALCDWVIIGRDVTEIRSAQRKHSPDCQTPLERALRSLEETA